MQCIWTFYQISLLCMSYLSLLLLQQDMLHNGDRWQRKKQTFQLEIEFSKWVLMLFFVVETGGRRNHAHTNITETKSSDASIRSLILNAIKINVPYWSYHFCDSRTPYIEEKGENEAFACLCTSNGMKSAMPEDLQKTITIPSNFKRTDMLKWFVVFVVLFFRLECNTTNSICRFPFFVIQLKFVMEFNWFDTLAP